MSPVLQAALASWSVPWIPTLAIVLTALIYLRGWYLLRCAGFPLLPAWRVWSFLAGLFALWVALAGPMDVFNSWLLTAHMVQHMMLMMIAPPLVLLGAPLIPLVRGLPVFAAREFAGPFLNWKAAQRLGRLLTQPVFALVLMGIVMLGWHVPVLYELAIRSPGWHEFEHACFLITSLIFWWPAIHPWPSQSQWPRWSMVPYLLIADVLNTILSAALVFADRVLYPSYADAPRVFGLSALQDQVAAGAIMWVVGSVAFLIPAMLIAVQCLARQAAVPELQRLKKRKPILAGSWQRAMAKFGFNSVRADAVSFLALFVATGLAFSALLAFSGSDEDELVPQARQQTAAIRLTIYTSGDNLDIGANDISVLVQDATGSPILDTQIEVSATRQGVTTGASEIHGREAETDNKLLKAATIEVPAAGAWLLHVNVKHDARAASITFPTQAVVPTSGIDDWWPYFVFPAIGLLLLLVYSRRAHRRHTFARQHAIEAAASR
jgi:cytochrome c oxidase assembly factor CtaG